MTANPKDQKTANDADLRRAQGGFLKSEIPVQIGAPNLDARTDPVRQDARSMDPVAGAAALGKVGVAGWTNKQAIDANGGAVAQSDPALSAVAGTGSGALGHASVAGWTNKQKIDGTASAAQQVDSALNAAGAASLGQASVAGWTNKQKIDGTAGTQRDFDTQLNASGMMGIAGGAGVVGSADVLAQQAGGASKDRLEPRKDGGPIQPL